MHWMTLEPSWIIQDIIIIALTVFMIVFILRKEPKEMRIPILLEFFFFVMLYAGVYENFATVMGWYEYGHSILMYFNVPLTVPLVEFLILYTLIRFFNNMKLPRWTAPLFVGGMAIIFDLIIDPVSTSQYAIDAGREIARWTWFQGHADVLTNPIVLQYSNPAILLNEPVKNFTGWLLISGYATIFILLGRHWYKKTGYKTWVGYVYPLISILAALFVLFTPISSFFLNLGPFFATGSQAEWWMFVFWLASFAALLIWWRGRMIEKLNWHNEYIIFVIFGSIYLSSLIFNLIGGYWNNLLVAVPCIILSLAILAIGFKR